MKILVIHQAIDESRADEADTLLQAKEIETHLNNLKHETTRLGFEKIAQLEIAIMEYKPDAVFNLVESLSGSDRFAYLAPALLESQKLSFTGNSALPLILASEKIKLKHLLSSQDVPTPIGMDSNKETRFIVKSVSEHASFGIDENSIVTGLNAAQTLIELKTQKYGGEWLAEEYIEGREFNLSLLETQNGMLLLPPAEILFEGFAENAPRIVDYKAKWDESSHAYNNTPRQFCEVTEDMKSIAAKTWKALGLRGYARIDLRMDSNGKLWVIDINPNPCLSSDAGFMASAKQYGIESQEVINTILENRIYG
jgi:D-alanine-D-alanine ligase